MKYVVPAAIAIGVGLVTLITYFVEGVQLLALRMIFTDWAVILGGLAVLVGFLNLLISNVRRIETRSEGWPYNLVTVGVALLTVIVGASGRIGTGTDTTALYEETSLIYVLFTGVIVASQAALASLVMFFLVLGAVRMLKSKLSPWSIGFLVVVVIVLVGWMPFGFMSFANAFRDWLISIPASAGARGILLGVALGTLAMGLRVLTGVERPYKD